MKRSPWLLLPLVVALGAALPHASAVAAPPASSAAPAAPWIPPQERSPKPRPDEWSGAEPLALPRPHARCRATRLREWVRIACKSASDEYMGARIVGGSHEEVALEAPRVEPGEPRSMRHADVVFPVRRGDRRLLEIPRSVSAGFKSYSIEEEAMVIISALWLPGDAGPTITVH